MFKFSNISCLLLVVAIMVVPIFICFLHIMMIPYLTIILQGPRRWWTLGKLVHDFDCKKSADVFYPVLAKQIHYFKETEGGRSTVCKAVDELAERRRLDAMFDVVKNLMETMKLSVEQAMEAMKLSDEDKAILLKRF